jgi:metal-responsive CopG/Arc/MetJ family transcriptional regulator
MKRISVFIREDQINNLEKIADLKGLSSSELIREAIDTKLLTEFGKNSKEDVIQNSRGLLKDRFDRDIKSGKIVEDIRAEWEQRVGRNKK